MSAGEPLLALLAELKARGYRFVTPTPETHRRVVGRRGNTLARDLRDVFGWSLPFEKEMLPADLWRTLAAADMVSEEAGIYRSRVRVASLEGRLFLHSAYPTVESDAVFFGPDSYRFVRFLQREVGSQGVGHLVDIGAGAGVGAIIAASLFKGTLLTMVDSNARALRFARINAAHAGIEADFVQGDGIAAAAGPIDLAIANPPFMMDEAGRAYRDGGDLTGAALSLDWTLEAARRIEPGGRVLLYTGSAIMAGEDRLYRELSERLPPLGCTLRYDEIDPDIFGEQLDCPGYEKVERIAAIGAVIDKLD